jgi:hypothetical protein
VGIKTAVIPSYTAKKGLDARASVKFLDSVLPISLSGSVKLDGEVDLDQITANVQRKKMAKQSGFDEVPGRIVRRSMYSDSSTYTSSEAHYRCASPKLGAPVK